MHRQIVYLQPNEELAEQFTDYLESDEISILHAKSGEEALQIIEKEKVLLLLIDINIPDMRLRELVERVRRVSPQIILNVCIDVLDPLLITKLSNRHNIHKIYVAPWNIDEIIEEMRDSLEIAMIDEQINVREQNITSEIESINETLESLKDTLKKQQRSFAKLSNVTKCFTEAYLLNGEVDSDSKRKLEFCDELFLKFLKMQTTGSFDADKFENEIKEDIISLRSHTTKIKVGEISTSLLGEQSRAYAQNMRFGIYLIAKFYAEFYREFEINVSSHYVTTRLVETCIQISVNGEAKGSENLINDYLEYVKNTLSEITTGFRVEEKDDRMFYCSFPVARE